MQDGIFSHKLAVLIGAAMITLGLILGLWALTHVPGVSSLAPRSEDVPRSARPLSGSAQFICATSNALLPTPRSFVERLRWSTTALAVGNPLDSETRFTILA